MNDRIGRYAVRCLRVAAIMMIASVGAPAHAEAAIKFDIASQPLSNALIEFGDQSGRSILASPELTGAATTRGVSAETDPETALRRLLDDTGLSFRRDGEVFVIVKADHRSDFGSGTEEMVAGIESSTESTTASVETTRRGGIEEVIVTGQKKEERIQDVPIAISAFSSEDLDAQKLEGGYDLLKAIPNVTFSKSNFSGYNFSIRGIGTKAISATTDPGVSVSFNNTGLIQNRLFEQEYFDVERIEVLRGPQGTLYGRNATGGVINLISAKPKFNEFEGSVKGEVGNYGSRRGVGMLNIPLLDDMLALRAAGSYTQRDGYGYNDVTGNSVDGRDLWSARGTLSFKPTERIRADLIWEHFSEDDNRARTSKQLCHRDNGPESVGNQVLGGIMQRALFSAGCKPGSLYSDAAFDTPNGLALPLVFAVPALGGDGQGGIGYGFTNGVTPAGVPITAFGAIDPYANVRQNRDLRTISSLRDPLYRAEADVYALNVTIEMDRGLTVVSQTLYNDDSVYSTQDYNRFNTQAIFNDSSSWLITTNPGNPNYNLPSPYQKLTPGGIYCDPQLGCSNSIVGQDLATAESTQFSQEFRLQSAFEGPVNFSVGANYTRFEFEANYYVFYNLLTMLAQMSPLGTQPDYTKCAQDGFSGDTTLVDIDDPSIPLLSRCIYVDPNPLESINGEGHNYFRSRNPYVLDSRALFGELYWQINPTLKLTAGLRYTDDRKDFTPVPTQLLLSSLALVGGGTVYRGYPENAELNQRWTEPTGRLVLDWKPDLSFTDETLIYGSYARGYKGGGANPPSIGFSTQTVAEQLGIPPGFPLYDQPTLSLTANNYPATFEPEFVNAIEIGTKNTLLGGAMMLNVTAFYYDYKDYQVSKIVDRTAVNENFDAEVWGLEFETLFAPTPDLVVNANLGLLDTRVGGGARSIDITNRTQGNPGYVVVKPWFQLPSNCVVPVEVAEFYLNSIASSIGGDAVGGYGALCGGTVAGSGVEGYHVPVGYNPANNPNGGAGFYADLEGKELPNSPHWTANIGAQYTWHFRSAWDLSLRGDYYRQGNSYARVYNTVNDKLKGWGSANARITVSRPTDDLQIELYVKNVFDDDPITDAFINSDDSGLTTNVFVLDPRLIGLSIKKGF